MGSNVYHISPEKLTFRTIFQILKNEAFISLSDEATERIIKCREYLDEKEESNIEPIYGINTGTKDSLSWLID